MIPHIVDAKYTSAYKVWLKFEDGTEGEINLEDELWGEVFEPLKDQGEFKKVCLNRELNTIQWENGADFAPEFLYVRLKASQLSVSKS